MSDSFVHSLYVALEESRADASVRMGCRAEETAREEYHSAAIIRDECSFSSCFLSQHWGYFPWRGRYNWVRREHARLLLGS